MYFVLTVVVVGLNTVQPHVATCSFRHLTTAAASAGGGDEYDEYEVPDDDGGDDGAGDPYAGGILGAAPLDDYDQQLGDASGALLQGKPSQRPTPLALLP